MNPPGSTDKPLDLTSEAAQKETEAKAAAEKSKETAAAAPDQREQALSTATESMRREVAAKQAALTAAGRSLDAPTQRYLEQYFQSAIHRFDADKDGKISEQESKAFHDSMLKKTNEIVGGMIEAGKAEKKMEKAAEKAEKIDTKEAQKSLESVQALGDLTDLQQANGELQKIQSQNGAFQQTVQTQLEGVQQFSKSFNEFQQAQEGFGHFAQLWDAVVNSTERSLAIASMKASLETTRGAVDATLTALRDKQKILDANGEKIKAAFTRTRQEAIKAREEKKAEVEKAKQEQADQIEARKKEYARLEAEKKKLEARRKEIAERQAKSEKIRADWRQQNEQERIKTQKTNCGHEKDDILAELHGFGLILDNPDIPPSVKDGIRKDYEAAKARQQKNKLALEVIDLKEKSGAEFAQKLDADQKIAAQELQTADSHLARQRESQLSLQQNIDLLNDLQSQYATSSAEVDKYYNEKIKILDEQAESVDDDFVLNSSMARQQSITALEQAKTSLSGLSVETAGLFNPMVMLGSLSKGIGGLLHSAAKSIDGSTREALNLSRKGEGAAEDVAYYASQILSVFSGFVSGGLELGGGIFTLSGGIISDIGSIGTALANRDSKHLKFPTIAGLGAIIGYDSVTGEFTWDKVGDTWWAMGKALVGYGENWGYHKDPVTGEEQWRDEYGTAIGKSVFNVLSMFVGAGAVGAGAKAGAAAGKVGMVGRAGLAANVARNAAIEAARAAGKSAGMFTGRGAQMLAFAKSLAQNLRPAALAEATKAAKIAPGGKATQAAAFGRSVASSAFETTAAAGRAAWKATTKTGRAGLEAARKLRYTPKQAIWGAAVAGAKATGWALKTSAKITYEIAMMPYRIAWGFGKGVRGLGREVLTPAIAASQRMGRAAKIMEQYGDDYAKAQQSIRRIIDDDPVLSKKAMEIENAGLAPEIAAQRRLALEAEAAKKLVATEPHLAEAYANFRGAAREMTKDTETVLASTRKSIDSVKRDPGMKSAHDRYAELRNELNKKPQDTAAKQALDDFEADPVRMGKARRYQEALNAETHMVKLADELKQLSTDIVGQHSDDAARLVDEINEARAVHAPPDAPAYGTAITDTPAFAREFRSKYNEAVQKRNYDAISEMVDSLGIHRPEGPLIGVLDGMSTRARLRIPDEPLTAKVTDKLRETVSKKLDEAVKSGNYRAYQEFSDKLRAAGNRDIAAYLDWAEDVFKKHPNEAGTMILASERDFLTALKVNQGLALKSFEQYTKRIERGIEIGQLRKLMKRQDLTTHWEAALEQIHQRVTLRNRQISLSADAALNLIRSESRYAGALTPDLTAAEAALRLERIYGKSDLGKTAALRPGSREVATDIKLKDGVYSIQVADDGLVRLIDAQGNPVLPKAATTSPAAVPAATVSAVPSTAPTPTATPAALPKASPAMRQINAREARLEAAINQDPTLQALAAQGDAGLLIARGRARIAEYRSRVGTVHLERRLQSLQDDLKNAKNANNPADIQKAKTALDDFIGDPAYLEYQRYGTAERAVSRAETSFNRGRNPIEYLRSAQKNLVRDDLVNRLNAKLTPEEAAELLARESLPAARGGAGGARLAGQVDDLGTVTLKGGKQYQVRMLESGELRLFDDAGQVVTPTARPAAAPTTAPAAAATTPAAAQAAPTATPTAAPAIPRKAPAERMREAVATREQAIRDIGRGRERVLQLEERIPQLQQRIEAMEVRGVSGPRLKAARESLVSLQDELDRLNVAVAENAQKLWATRGDYWKARLLQKGQDIRQYVAVQRRIDWLKAKNKTLGELAAKGVQVLRNPAKNLWESLKKQVDTTIISRTNTPGDLAKMHLFARAGMEVTSRLEALQAAAAPRLPAALPILAELRRDQYNILAEIQKGADRSLGLPGDEEFAALSPQEQTAALGAAYRRLEGGGGLPEEGGIYTDVQKQYIGDKKQLARQALAGLGTEGTELTPQSVTAALDNAFGPQGLNDSRVDYQIEVEGLKIKVDQDGNRTYEGIDGWVASAPTRTLVRGVLGEVEQNHGAITPAELAKANQNKPVNDLEEFQKYLQEAVRAAVAGKNGDLTLQPGAIVESPSLNAEGEPLFTARVDANSKIEVTVDPAWASATYEAIKSRPDQQVKPAPERIAGAPRRAPRRAPETSETPDDENWDPDNPYS